MPEFLFTLWPYLLAILAAVLLITFMLVSAIFSVWLERKVAGRIQDRLGPTRVGGKFGWLQTLADGVKLLCKEDIIPTDADRLLFRFGPYIALVGSFLAFMALPYGHGVVAQNTNVAIFFMLAVLSSEVFGVILIGYGSGSKWSLFGGMREAAQMVSYEVPMALCLLVPIIVVGTMNLNTVGYENEALWDWLIFRDPFTFAAFWCYFTCAMASCKRAPFDLAEAESELVAGFHTEYSGFRWLTIFMAEYGSMFAVSGIATIMFLGGWSTGIPFYLLGFTSPTGMPSSDLVDVFRAVTGNEWIGWGVGNLLNVGVFIFKGWALVFVMMWVRWTLPRLRIDQVMMTCLKFLLPIGCFLLMSISLWRLLMPEAIQYYFRFVMLGAVLIAKVVLLKQVIFMVKAPPGTGMPGMWRTSKEIGYQALPQTAGK